MRKRLLILWWTCSLISALWPGLALGQASVTVRLFLDLQAPDSREAFRLYRDALQDVPRGLLVLHYVPAVALDAGGQPARAATALRSRGLEIAFVEALLREPVLDSPAVARAVASVGIDPRELAEQAKSSTVTREVDRDRQAALALGVRAAPMAFLSGRPLSGLPPPEALQRALQVALEESNEDYRKADASGGTELRGLQRHAPDLLAPFAAWRSGAAAATVADSSTRTGLSVPRTSGGDPSAAVASTDLSEPEALGDLSPLPAFGTGVPVYLFVDFTGPGSREAFRLLRPLVDSPDLPIRLHMASCISHAEPGVTASGATFAVAARLGKGLEMAERLFASSHPNDWSVIRRLVRKLRLPKRAFQNGIDAPSTGAVARLAADLSVRLDMADDPVIYVGDRLYTGPLDLERLTQAVRQVRDATPPTDGGPTAAPGAPP
jgi:hypothetical protein